MTVVCIIPPKNLVARLCHYFEKQPKNNHNSSICQLSNHESVVVEPHPPAIQILIGQFSVASANLTFVAYRAEDT